MWNEEGGMGGSLAAMRGLAVAAMLMALGCAGPRESYRWYTHPDVLNDPVRVRAVTGDDVLELEDGRRIRLLKKVEELEKWIESSGHEVEVVPQSTGPDGVIQAEVFIRQHRVLDGVELPYTDVWFRAPLRPRQPSASDLPDWASKTAPLLHVMNSDAVFLRSRSSSRPKERNPRLPRLMK
jgi:hypothetical protein